MAATRAARASGVIPAHEFFRFCLGFADAAAFGLFLLPRGRPGPRRIGAAPLPPPTIERISFSA
jgi:hypothetical protein